MKFIIIINKKSVYVREQNFVTRGLEKNIFTRNK